MSRQASEETFLSQIIDSRQTEYEPIPFYDEAFPIRVLLDLKARIYDPAAMRKGGVLWHEQLEIIYVTEGELICESDFHHYVCQAGDIFVVNPCETHDFFSFEKSARYHCLMIDLRLCGGRDDISVQKYVEPMTHRKIRFHHVIKEDEKAKGIIREILEDYMEEKNGYELAVKGNVLRLLALLFGREISKEAAKRGADHESVAPALRYIADHYAEDISLSALADCCGMSRSYFCRHFHEVTGRTAISYLNEYRLSKARALLLSTAYPVSEIAASVGFWDSSYFTRKFKELYGVSPMAMRKK